MGGQQQKKPKGPTLQLTLDVALEDLYNGATVEVRESVLVFVRALPCLHCSHSCVSVVSLVLSSPFLCSARAWLV